MNLTKVNWEIASLRSQWL